MSSICEICSAPMQNYSLDNNNVLYKCTKCRHITRDLSVSDCNSREQAWGGSGLFDKLRNYLAFKSIVKKSITNSEHVFEIGFGSGWLLKQFLKIGKKIAGVDKETLKVYIEEDVTKNGEIFFGNAEDFQIPNEKYDLVLAIHLVEHLIDVKKVFKSAYDGLKKGGSFYIMTPSGDSDGLKLFKTAWWNLEDPTHIRFFSEKSIRIALEQAGFKKITINKSLLDSMTVEVNSFIRLFYAPKGKNGILSGKLIMVLDLLLLMPFMLLRLLFPKMRSTIEIIAEK